MPWKFVSTTRRDFVLFHKLVTLLFVGFGGLLNGKCANGRSFLRSVSLLLLGNGLAFVLSPRKLSATFRMVCEIR